MLDDSLHRDALTALDRARPDSVVGELRAVLKRHCDVRGVCLLIADHQGVVLRQVHTEVRVPINQGRAGESFATQAPVTHVGVDGVTDVYLPVTVHGDRVGVLHLTLGAPVGVDELGRLHDLATLVGYVLAATHGQTDVLTTSARARRLSLAAELQWQLLPSRGGQAPDYLIAGHLKPAYDVCTDNFDWSQDAQRFSISVTDGAQNPRGALLLPTLAVTAIRNARRAKLGIEDQAFLADEAVFAHHSGQRFVGALLVQVDLTTGRSSVIKAGSPEMILLRSGTIHPLGFIDQLPLGMFEGTEYVEQSMALTAGDRLVLMTDGVLEALSPRGERYADRRLHDILASTSRLRPGRVVRAVVDDLIEHCERDELDDDAVVVCLDWSGMGDPDRLTVPDVDFAVRGERRRLRAVPPRGAT